MKYFRHNEYRRNYEDELLKYNFGGNMNKPITNTKNIEKTMEEQEKVEEQGKLNTQFENDRKIWLTLFIIGLCVLIVGVFLNYETYLFEKVRLIPKIFLICLVLYLTIKFYLNYKHYEYSKGDYLTNYENNQALHLTPKGKMYLNPFDLIFGANSFNLRKLKSLTIIGTYVFKKKIVNFSRSVASTPNPKMIERLSCHNLNLDAENAEFFAKQYSNLKGLYLINCKFKNLSTFLDYNYKTIGVDKKRHKFINCLETIEIINCEISNEYWKPSEKLYRIKINNSKIKSIPKALNESTTCYEADFANNEITFVELTNSNLSKLNLKNNKIKTEDIYGLPKRLDSINLSNNPLKLFPEIIFESKDIRFIDLSNCEIELIKLEHIQKVKENWRIKSINMKGNPLSELTKTNLYKELPNIVEFD